MTVRRTCAVLALLMTACAAGCSSSPSSPTQPSPAPPAGALIHFESLVGTAWTGTARIGTAGGSVETRPVAIAFIWGSACDVPGFCAWGANPYALGTADQSRLRILGYNDDTTPGSYRREIYVGDAVQGQGRWDSASVTADTQRLQIASTDFVLEGRRGVVFDLVRTAWPADVHCPLFRTCGP